MINKIEFISLENNLNKLDFAALEFIRFLFRSGLIAEQLLMLVRCSLHVEYDGVESSYWITKEAVHLYKLIRISKNEN